MANNRMYLKCPHCPDAEIMLAKYYPNTGWYCFPEAQETGDKLDKFFDEHCHESNYGSGFILGYEQEPDFDPAIDKTHPAGSFEERMALVGVKHSAG